MKRFLSIHFLSSLFVLVYAVLCVSMINCTPGVRKLVVHAVTENCEMLELPLKVCVAIEELAPILDVLLLAQKEGKDAELTVHMRDGSRETFIVPLARIPGAVGSITGAAMGASLRRSGSPAVASASASASASAPRAPTPAPSGSRLEPVEGGQRLRLADSRYWGGKRVGGGCSAHRFLDHHMGQARRRRVLFLEAAGRRPWRGCGRRRG